MVKLKQRAYSLLIVCLTALMVVVFAIGALLVPPQTTTALAEEGKYVKVTEAPTDWSGDYLIVCETDKVAFNGGLPTLDAVSNTISVTISDGKIEANNTTNAAKFTIAKSGTGYSILSASGKYIGHSKNENKLTASSTALVNTLSMNADGSVNIICSGGAYLRYNATSGQTRFRYFKSSTYTNQKAICLYKYVEATSGGETPDVPACEHTLGENVYEQLSGNQHKATAVCIICGETITTVEQTNCNLLETDGKYICDCDREVAINEITLYVNGEQYGDVLKTDKNQSVVLPTPTETFANYTFYGWVEAETDELPGTVYKAGANTFTVEKTLYALYASGAPESWNLVTDAANLAVGNEIIIADKDSKYALSTNQKTSNRGAVAISVEETKVTINDDVQIITLEEGEVANTFAFNVGTGYLYAASSSSNHLKTQTTNDANGSWLITIAGTGVATIRAQGNYTRNWLRYNYNNGAPLFACYGSGQTDVVIYKKTGGGAADYKTNFDLTCAHTNTDIDEKAATCTEAGYRKVVCVDCTETIESVDYEMLGHDWNAGEITTEATCQQKQVITKTCQRENCGETKTEEGAFGEHDYVDNVCTVCGAVDPMSIDYSGTYYFVGYKESQNYLYLQNKLYEDKDYYKGTDSGITTLEVPVTISEAYADYIFRIVKNVDGTYSIYDGADEKLYDKDYLIESIKEGTVQIHDESGYYFSINKSLFDRAKLYNSEQIKDIILIPYIPVEPEVPQEPKFSGASLTIGSSLDVNFYVTLPEGVEAPQMNFKLATIDVTVDGVEEGGRYKYVFEGLAPQFMGDTITATLLYGEGIVYEYSVKTYAVNTLAKAETSNELKQFLVDLLTYGAAAQKYQGYNTENLVTNGVDMQGVTPSTATPTEASKYVLTTEDGGESIFASANLWFDNVNKICVKLNAPENVTLKVNGVEAELNGNVYYTDAIYATGFAATYTFTVYVDGELQQTLTYSVNSYAYSKMNSATMGELALALYRYGVSAGKLA